MKKLLLITFLMLTTIGFAQQNEKANTVIKKSDTPITITSVSASPNPFSFKTSISFKSSQDQHIEFTVKNLLGKTLYKEGINVKTGVNTINFERNDISKGMYIYSLQSESEVVSKRLVIQ